MRIPFSVAPPDVTVMRRGCAAIGLVLALSGCGAPSWPEPREPEPEPTTRLAIVPADPIAGEHVDLVIPVQSDGVCHPWSGTRETSVAGGVTTFTITRSDPEACAVALESGGGSIDALGPLAEGRHAIVIEGHVLDFEVRAASTHPGEPPLWWRAAWAVVEVQPVPSACVDDMGQVQHPLPYRERSARLFHQIAARHPSWSEPEIEAALCRTQMVQIAEVSPRELRYRYSGGSLCLVRDMIGTVRVRDDGTLEVGEPHVLREEHVDC